MIRFILRGLYWMLNGVLQRVVVDAVPVATLDALPPVIGVPVDLPGWWKWWFRRCGRSRPFAFYRYAELR